MLSALDGTIRDACFESILCRTTARTVRLKVKRFLRSPRVIVGEIVAIALACVLGATFPQSGTASLADLARLREAGPVTVALVNFFALDHVFQSIWFLAITLLASASLLIVVIEQIRRLRVMWSLNLTEAKFYRAPFRAEFERPPRLATGGDKINPRVEVKTVGRLGLAGSPIFHAGLLLVIVAATLRALFAVEAAVDLLEGETLPPTAQAWTAQWPGLLARPFRLDYPLTLNSVTATRYESGDLRELRVQVSLHQPDGIKNEEIGINRELQAPGGRLFMGADFGPTALIEWQKDGERPIRRAVLLASRGKGLYEGAWFGRGLVRAYLRAQLDGSGRHPLFLDVRVMDVETKALLFAGLMRVGEEVSLRGGEILKLHGVPFWVRLRGSRDPALWVAYIGLALVLVGAVIIFTIVKVDTCVVVTQAEGCERVFVALRAQRFAPLFYERFRRLVRDQGGQA